MPQLGFRPCMSCDKRYPGCHGKCEDYLKIKALKDKAKKDSAPYWECVILASQRKYGSVLPHYKQRSRIEVDE